jgi:hypothetical protein
MQRRRRPGQLKVKFTPADDMRLAEMVNRWGAHDWAFIAQNMPGRNARQCRERWTNYINPGLVHRPWTPAEDQLLTEKYGEFGRKWQVIAMFFPTRSKNQVKNRWLARERHDLVAALDLMPSAAPPVEEVEDDAVSLPAQNSTLWDALFAEPSRDDAKWDEMPTRLF